MVVASLAGLVSCGRNSAAPSPNPGGGAGFTFTITAGGVSPKTMTVPRGTQVTFVNNSSRAHDVSSDPHPEHTDCPEINQVGHLNPTQSRQTGNLNTARSCGFHDHDDPFNTTLAGTITVQ
jgi:plastocyanin